MEGTKFCIHCGEQIAADAAFCTKCGKRVEKPDENRSGIVINNVVTAAASVSSDVSIGRKLVRKWTAFFLCLFGGLIGLHKFYEGKIGMGILYAFTGGLFIIGWFVDIFNILGKPDPYSVS